MSERDQSPERVKNDARAEKTINIQLSKVLDSRKAPLVDVVYVLLKTAPYVFEDLIHHRNREGRIIPLQVIREHGE